MTKRTTASLIFLFIVLLLVLPKQIQNHSFAQSARDVGSYHEELKALYKADQADRRGGIRGEELRIRDETRKERVKELILQNKLGSGEDFYCAAMIFQHSTSSEDYLKAHVLATIAGFKGHGQGKWLSAATLDRYLTFIGQSQFFGTQYERDASGRWRPGFVDAFVSDSMRVDYHLPSIMEMEQRAAAWNK